jgi:hypothetical protein
MRTGSKLRLVIAVLVASTASSGVTALVLGVSEGTASPIAVHASAAKWRPVTAYRPKRGDFVDIPSLGWTCTLTTLPHRRRAFYCDTNAKPIFGMWFTRHRIVVNLRRPPVRVHYGYAFTYH